MDVSIDATLDRDDLMARVMNDKDLLHQLVIVFDSQLAMHFEQIEHAFHSHNARLLQTQAHSLKGAIGNFTTKAAFQAASQLESYGRDHNLDHAESVYTCLKTEIIHLQTALALLLSTFK